MAAPVPLRSDFDAEALRGLAKGSRDPAQTRRLLALSVIAAGGLRSEAAEIGGVGLQTVRDFRRGLQCRWTGRVDRRQGPRGPSAPERRPARCPQGAGRTGTDAGRTGCGAVAVVRSGPNPVRGSRQRDGGQIVSGQAIIAGRDAPPVPEVSEQALDPFALPGGDPAVLVGHHPGGRG